MPIPHYLFSILSLLLTEHYYLQRKGLPGVDMVDHFFIRIQILSIKLSPEKNDIGHTFAFVVWTKEIHVFVSVVIPRILCQ